jgi:ribosome-associated toxin RatA of RatAB toxin-antitoxin module
MPPFFLMINMRAFLARFTALLALCVATSSAADTAGSRDDDWKLTSHRDGVLIYSRTRPGSSIKEFKAIGKIEASPRTVMSVVDDIDAYTRFMPYVIECREITRDAISITSYQRLSPPFCTDRDYTIRVRHEVKALPAGKTYASRWELANGAGPAESNRVVRVKVNEGGWLFEPAGNNTTRATYRIYTDCGGAIPAFIANTANEVGIGKLFEAVRKQVKEEKYSNLH